MSSSEDFFEEKELVFDIAGKQTPILLKKKILGSGAFGTVRLGRDMTIRTATRKRAYAVKCLPRYYILENKRREKYQEREINLQYQI